MAKNKAYALKNQAKELNRLVFFFFFKEKTTFLTDYQENTN